MKAIVGVISALVIVGIAALLLSRAQQVSSPPDPVAGTAFRDKGTPAAQPSVSMTPWPDLDELTNDDSRPTGAASLDGSVRSRPKIDFQSIPAHVLTTLSSAGDIAPRPPASPPHMARHASQRTGHAGQRRH
jgi:hypothetical protein